jgi:hypothetical protein
MSNWNYNTFHPECFNNGKPYDIWFEDYLETKGELSREIGRKIDEAKEVLGDDIFEKLSPSSVKDFFDSIYSPMRKLEEQYCEICSRPDVKGKRLAWAMRK